VRSASGLLLSLKSMAEVTANWLVSHAHQDGRPRMTLCSSPARLQCLSPKHCKQTIRVRRWLKRRMKANPPSQIGVDNPLPNSRRPDHSRQGYGKRWLEGLISLADCDHQGVRLVGGTRWATARRSNATKRSRLLKHGALRIGGHHSPPDRLASTGPRHPAPPAQAPPRKARGGARRGDWRRGVVTAANRAEAQVQRPVAARA